MIIKKEKLTKENLLLIEKIDNTYYKNNITGIAWYLERFNENHYGYLLFDEKNLVGYIISVPIKKELYNSITNGVLINDIYINPQMFVDKSKFNYIYSCVILDKYKHKGYGKKLLEYLFKDAKGYYCALAISDEGYKFLMPYMNLVKNIDSHTNIFETKK